MGGDTVSLKDSSSLQNSYTIRHPTLIIIKLIPIISHTHTLTCTLYSFNVLKIFLHVKIMKIKKRAILSRTGHGREGERGKEGGREGRREGERNVSKHSYYM